MQTYGRKDIKGFSNDTLSSYALICLCMFSLKLSMPICTYPVIIKTCNANILQLIKNMKEWSDNHQGSAEVFIASFARIVFPMKHHNNEWLNN